MTNSIPFITLFLKRKQNDRIKKQGKNDEFLISLFYVFGIAAITTIHKIFQTDTSFHVRYCTTGKV